ncbi:MAG: hypothetical protein LBE55_05940 [Clostridiales bacterium]|jgi:hypothetical protein|nr:hypothetical protein [Clostridiales bacterium]
MRKSLYYAAGIFCLMASAVLLLNTNILPLNLANSISQMRYDSGYKHYYHIGFPIPKNNLRQGTVYLPVYSEREREQLWQVMLPFSIGDVEITESDEYFEAVADGEILRIYKYLDFMEYENLQEGRAGELIDENTARKLAEEFLEEFLPPKKPYDVLAERIGDSWTVTFLGRLSGMANMSFPTKIMLDAYGNITGASHYFFEYEALGAADVITLQAALAQLPREAGRKVYLKGYELAYGFEDSVLVPVYRFFGECADGMYFEEFIGALKFY